MNEYNNQPSRSQQERPQRPSGGRYLTKEERLRRKRKRHRQIMIQRGVLGAAALAILILIIVLIFKGCSGGKNDIVGTWRLDNFTAYQFENDGTGVMLLTNSQYDYTFKVKGDNLYIDYKDDILGDGSYTFNVEGDTLILTGGAGTSGRTYELVRVERE